ncbi:hypothetical protein [Fulvivirga sediminis]|uniref:Uncharacterized protein n=1 Tax=Fulvivirga sediminis TaxID=2803949 RepID=A0A937K267_9BACT|nr:hypothetical protein [Fulvivirga sediminis]MBL3658045.1 hypothetical protein [Fulvivirga sediminis]
MTDYKSPFPVLRYSGVNLQDINDQTLIKAKKVLLVELEHSDESILNVEGTKWTKNDIINLFEALSNVEHLTYYRWIDENPELRALLENNVLNFNDELYDEKIFQKEEIEGFKSFISPFLAQPLGKSLNQYFLRQEYAKCHKLLKVTELIESSYYDATFGKLQSSIKGMVEEIRIMKMKGVDHFREQQCNFINYYFVEFLNSLPNSFGSLRENFALAVISLSVVIQGRYAVLCKRLYLSLRVLDCSAEAKEIIENNLKVFEEKVDEIRRITSNDSDSSSGGAPVFSGVFMIVVVFIVILKTCSHNVKGSRSKADYDMDWANPVIQKVAHLSNMSTLKKWSNQQISSPGSVIYDSIAVIDNYPYAGEYHDLLEYRPTGGRKISISNASTYDVVVFLSTKWYNYSAFLKAEEEISFQIARHDYLQFYLGNVWMQASTSFSNNKTDQRECFSKVDSTTISFLDKIWQNRCTVKSNCGASHFSISQSTNSTIQFSADKKSGLVEVDNYFQPD